MAKLKFDHSTIEGLQYSLLWMKDETPKQLAGRMRAILNVEHAITACELKLKTEEYMNRIPIVCLVGSVKQQYDWQQWTKTLTSEGCVVLEAGVYGTRGIDVDEETWQKITYIHWKKIEMADIIGVIRKPNKTIGEDTAKDILYAQNRGKKIMDVDDISEYLKLIYQVCNDHLTVNTLSKL